MGMQMSLDAAQTNMTESQDGAAQVTADQPKPVTESARSTWLPTHVTEQTFQSVRRIFEANCAVARTFYDLAQRQQDFVLTTVAATLAGMPGTVARHVDIAQASAREAYRHNASLLDTWTMFERPSQAAPAAQHPATL
jgi:hypothetical protein